MSVQVMLDKLLCRLKKRGHRVVLFSQFLSQLDVFEDYLEMRGFAYCRLDGSVSRVFCHAVIFIF